MSMSAGVRCTYRLPRVAAAIFIAAAVNSPAIAQAPVPDRARAEYMIKNTLIALNHANLTGNFTVLRDLGSPRFRANNDAGHLAAIFAPMREQGIDLAPIVLFEPQLAAPITSDEEGRLRLVGSFSTRPLQVLFDLAFEPIGNRWMIADIAVNALHAQGLESENSEQINPENQQSNRNIQ